MDCKQTMARLQIFLDRELSEMEMLEVDMHLKACPPCENHFQFDRHLKRLVRLHACPENAPSSLRARICQKLRAN